MLFLSETKIDDSFTDTQFQVNNYHFWRADRTAHGGDIAAYVRSDLPCDRKRKGFLRLKFFSSSKMSLLHSDSISSTVFTFCWYVPHSELPVLLNSVSLDLMEILWKNESVKHGLKAKQSTCLSLTHGVFKHPVTLSCMNIIYIQ
jgi:hypothetical protein